MACNCCGPSGCKCKILNFDPNAEVESFTTYPFSYNMNYRMTPWIHRDYPEPLFMTTWDRKFGAHLASNHVKINGQLRYYGDFSYYSRKGIPAYAVNNMYYVEDGNGDNSGIYINGGNVPVKAITIFLLEEKQDLIKRECQLWVKFRKLIPILDNNGNFISWQEGPWGEQEMLHSIKWNDPVPAQIIITISGDHFNGPTSVELRYHCIDACQYTILNNYKTWILDGQADWIDESIIEFPLNPCKSYGKFDGTVEFRYTNCNNQPGLVITKTNNRSPIIVFGAYSSCGYQYGFSCTFSGYSGSNCSSIPVPCVPPYNDIYYCCGNIYGGYTTQADGVEICGPLHQISPYSTYVDDIHNRELINSKMAKFNGIWYNAPKTYVQNYDCGTSIQDVDPSVIYKAGTILATGV